MIPVMRLAETVEKVIWYVCVIAEENAIDRINKALLFQDCQGAQHILHQAFVKDRAIQTVQANVNGSTVDVK